MYFITNLCRGCLRHDISLVDITKEEAINDTITIINKLKICLPEIEWSENDKVLLCISCIDRLNSAFEFKNQCLKSVQKLKYYLSQLSDIGRSKAATFSVIVNRNEIDQQLVNEYVVSANVLNTHNNNVIPLQPVNKWPVLSKLILKNKLDDINKRDTNVSQILTQANTEELSVEIDPACFEYFSDDEQTVMDSSDNKDWEELISTNSISNPFLHSNNTVLDNSKSENGNVSNVELFKMGHFMARCKNKNDYQPIMCEQCGQVCDAIRDLREHVKLFHSGKFPYTCTHCPSVFVVKGLYEAHMERHKIKTSGGSKKDTITLHDLLNGSDASILPNSTDHVFDDGLKLLDKTSNDGLDSSSNVCSKSLDNVCASSNGNVRKHDDHRLRKRYFIKGEKNAKCNICSRRFSTQAYLQLHIQLHNRKENIKKMKVLNKDNYEQEQSDDHDKDLMENNNLQDESAMSKVEKCTLDVAQKEDSISNDDGLEVNGELVIEENDRMQLSDQSSEDLHPITQHGIENKDAFVPSILTDHLDEMDTFKDEPFDAYDPMNIVMIEGKAQCPFCYKLFGRKHDLKRHVNNIHLKSIQYVCHLCNSQFYEAFHLTRHLRQHNSFVRCSICMKDFSDLRDLKIHLVSVHENNCAPCQCGNCGLVFEKFKYLSDHMMQEHHRTIVYYCHICSREFKESRELSRHMVGHSGMYSCTKCQMTFATEHELGGHIKCHDGGDVSSSMEKKYECEVCQSKFKKKRYLSAHMNNRHLLHKGNFDSAADRVEFDSFSMEGEY